MYEKLFCTLLNFIIYWNDDIAAPYIQGMTLPTPKSRNNKEESANILSYLPFQLF
jgi:hypothetical protein